MSSINNRIRTVRRELGLSQTKFAKKIGLSQTNLSWMEKDGNRIMDRHIKQISLMFGVNEAWLRDGDGDRYKKDTFEDFLNDPTLDEIDRKILRSYINMNPTQRRYIKDWIMSIVEVAKTIQPVANESPPKDEPHGEMSAAP